MAEIEKTGKLTPGSRPTSPRRTGRRHPRGRPVPDVSTPEALKQLLINAKSIAYTIPKLGGTSSSTDEACGALRHHRHRGQEGRDGDRRRRRFGKSGAWRGRDRGHADQRDRPIKGAKLAAPLPGDTQLWTVYASAIPASSKEPAHARAFIDALTSSALAPRWTAGGFEPPK